MQRAWGRGAGMGREDHRPWTMDIRPTSNSEQGTSNIEQGRVGEGVCLCATQQARGGASSRANFAYWTLEEAFRRIAFNVMAANSMIEPGFFGLKQSCIMHAKVL